MSDIRLVYITAKDKAQAVEIGRALVERRLAACVNILNPMTSIYHWQGNIEQAEEAVLIAKTDAARADAAVKAVKELHTYEVPCAIILPIEGGNGDYLRWLAGEVKTER